MSSRQYFVILVFLLTSCSYSNIWTVKSDRMPACDSFTYMEDFYKYYEINDETAAKKLVMSGRCILLPDGIELQKMNSLWIDGIEYQEVREIGKTETYWTFDKALKRK